MKNKVKQAYKLMERCVLCPRKCGVNRLKGETGICKAGILPMVSSFHAHFGEEPPISGHKGSGTIFFTHCNLRCVFCQNYPISQLREGREVSVDTLAGMMLKLQDAGCHNINFVTPTHYMPEILEAIYIAKEKGLSVPLVYNCGGYESVGALKILNGVIDIYMPDIKYSDNAAAGKYSSAPDYFEASKKATREMYSQVGDLKIIKGIAEKGLLIRHLLLPGNLAGSEAIFDFIINELSPATYVNIMAQYYPCHRVFDTSTPRRQNAPLSINPEPNLDLQVRDSRRVDFPELSRRITRREYIDVIGMAKDKGLSRGFRQVLATIDRLKVPEWTDDLRE